MLEGSVAPEKAEKHARLSQEIIDGYRRERVTVAVAQVAHDLGFHKLTAAAIIKQAQMSRNTFYDLFSGSREGVEHAFRNAHLQLFEPVRTAGEEPQPWLDRVSCCLDALFATTAKEPLLAELSLVHSHGVGSEAGGYQAGLEAMAAALGGNREVGEFLAGAILWRTAIQVRRGEVATLPALRPELLALAGSFEAG